MNKNINNIIVWNKKFINISESWSKKFIKRRYTYNGWEKNKSYKIDEK
tara:strand:- start:488 stop:631 length:144 start_codon:yes stop_codon:yes gene_type:complete